MRALWEWRHVLGVRLVLAFLRVDGGAGTISFHFLVLRKDSTLSLCFRAHFFRWSMRPTNALLLRSLWQIGQRYLKRPPSVGVCVRVLVCLRVRVRVRVRWCVCVCVCVARLTVIL
jgi:hypothetical protein